MDKKKISLRELIWMTFSFISSVGFIGSFAVVANQHSGMPGESQGMGLHVVWVLAVEGIIAGLCAYAFAKLSKIHSNKNNGGAYVYSRTAFGRLTGYLVAAMQYVMLPFIISLQIMMLMRGFFDPNYIPKDSVLNISSHLGPFSDLILDSIGIVIYAVCASTVFFGIKIYKKLALTTGYIKWGTSLLLILAGLVLAIQHGNSNYNHWANTSQLTFGGFMYTFTSSFFYFTGFEQIITSTKNIENPEKNISKGLLISMGIVTTMYVVISLLFFASVDNFDQNMNIGTWSHFGTGATSFIVIAGSMIMLISQLAMKAQISMMNCFIGGTMIQPLADEGYVSEKYKTLNKDNVPIKAAKLNVIIAAATVAVWLIIPDIVNGTLITIAMKHHVADPSKAAQPFNLAMLTSVTSVITIFIYTVVILAVFKNRKLLKLKYWEMAAFGFTLTVLGIIFVYHYYSLINDNIISYVKGHNDSSLDSDTKSQLLSGLIAAIVEFSFTTLVVTITTLNYVFYYLPKYKLRMKKDPNIQRRLDLKFQLVNYDEINSQLSQGLNLEKEAFVATK